MTRPTDKHGKLIPPPPSHTVFSSSGTMKVPKKIAQEIEELEAYEKAIAKQKKQEEFERNNPKKLTASERVQKAKSVLFETTEIKGEHAKKARSRIKNWLREQNKDAMDQVVFNMMLEEPFKKPRPPKY